MDGNFLLPDGAHLIEHSGDEYRMQVSIPVDDDGFFGRQCPACGQLFRVYMR